MRILVNKKWRDNFVDYPKNKREYRIKVLGFKNMERLEDVYHIRPKSLRLLLNYFPVMGFGGTFYKTWSRLREDYRNEKYISCGFGEIIETAQDSSFSVGDLVGFVAPWHPALAERIVLPEKLIFKVNPSDLPKIIDQKILYLHLPKASEKLENRWWKNLRAWSVIAGLTISSEIQKTLADSFMKELKNTPWDKAETIDASNPTTVSESKGSTQKRNGKKTGVLFGYGNYAKINILPYARPFVDIQTVHEIDPTQIFMDSKVQKWDSYPLPRKGEKADAYFIATYNHFHAMLAIHALNQGAYALVEKPVVNDYDELNDLIVALKKSGPRLFIGFQKRYGPFNKWALEDLGVRRGEEPIFYNSIVYELKQPEFFWYNWPVSRSTFYANACHQIDHFLYLNNFSKPKNFDLKLLNDNTIVTWIELENGATLTSTFSEKGSSRVGPKDVVELKVTGKIVRILDATLYISEDNNRVIRKKKVLKPTSYKDMYQTIARKIANNEDGDSIDSIITSTKIMLDLEEKLQSAKGWGDRYEKAKQEFLKYFGGEANS